jgi:hypothetical protein
MGRLCRLLALVALLAIPASEAANPPQVAFKAHSNRTSLVLLDQTGGGVRELTEGKPGLDSLSTYSWSPDGSRIAYASDVGDGDIYILGVDDGRLVRVTTDGANDDPAWSPGGGRIAYVHGVQAPNELWLVDVATGDRRRLTSDGGLKEDPVWSTDGSRISFTRDGARVAVDAASGRRVPDTTDYRNWSPDRTRHAFPRSSCGAYLKGICATPLSSIYVVGADGRSERRLTGPLGRGPYSTLAGHPDDNSSEPAWWPDGSRLFFSRVSQAYVMNADGTCEQPFGPRTLLLGEPAWRPESKPSLPPTRCADVRVRSKAARSAYGRRDRPAIHLALENDGNETATGLVLSLRVVRGRVRVRPPLRSCRGGAIVRCPLPPLGRGRSRQLTVPLTRPTSSWLELRASVTAREPDSDRATNVSTARIDVLDCDVVGSPGADRLVGTARRDTICGLPGADMIAARGGNDTIAAGAGADTIRPGPGRDAVSGGEGRDRVYARDGQRDLIDCGPFLDTVVADGLDKLVRCERVSRR